MENKPVLYDDGLKEFPRDIVLTENMTLAAWIAAGTAISWQLSHFAAILYFGYSAIMILFIMRKLVCTRCYYYGRTCHVGWGKLSSLLFKKGDINEFSSCMGMKIAPFFFISLALIPIILGTASLVHKTSILTVILMAVLVILVIISSVFSRKKSCSMCKMKTICPGSAAK